MNISRRPSISQIGHIGDHAHQSHLSGWNVGLCARGCWCHRNPLGSLVLYEDAVAGRLGLVSFRPSCDCCRPWEFFELRGVVHDLRAIRQLPVLEAH